MVVAIVCELCLRARRTVHHSSRDISISGLAAALLLLVVHQCRIYVDCGNTYFELAVVENFASAARITVILTLEALGCVSQHKCKIAPVSK